MLIDCFQKSIALRNKFNPVLIHSDVAPSDRNASLKALKDVNSRVVVCVNVFDEPIILRKLSHYQPKKAGLLSFHHLNQDSQQRFQAP